MPKAPANGMLSLAVPFNMGGGIPLYSGVEGLLLDSTRHSQWVPFVLVGDILHLVVGVSLIVSWHLYFVSFGCNIFTGGVVHIFMHDRCRAIMCLSGCGAYKAYYLQGQRPA